MGLTDEKTESPKSRDTVPLRGLLKIKSITRLQVVILLLFSQIKI
jgi:hypothetical protein